MAYERTFLIKLAAADIDWESLIVFLTQLPCNGTGGKGIRSSDVPLSQAEDTTAGRRKRAE